MHIPVITHILRNHINRKSSISLTWDLTNLKYEYFSSDFLIKLIPIATMIILTRRPESPTDEPNTTLPRAQSPARAPGSHSQDTRQDWRRIPMSSVLRRHMQPPTETPVAPNIQFGSGPWGTPFWLSQLFNLLQLLDFGNSSFCITFSVYKYDGAQQRPHTMSSNDCQMCFSLEQ